jgi:hypothetical protein
MSNRSCQYCLFFEQCSASRPCQHYSPIEPEDDDDLIELGRKQFAAEWRAYMTESQDSDF